MKEFLIISIIGFAIWFFASGVFRNSFQSADTMSQEALVSAFIETKKKILLTSPYEKEKEYIRLNNRMNDLMEKILGRHERYILDFEAKRENDRFSMRQYTYHDSDGISRTSNNLPDNLNFSNYSDDQLIYWCFFLWFGGSIKGVGEIDSNPKLMLKILKLLIERDNPDALFLKGMTKKYGVTVYAESFPYEAKELLEAAYEKGVGAAAVELRDIENFFQLNGLKSVHFSSVD